MIHRETVARPEPRTAGFTMTELLVVVAIIMTLAAVGLPAIARYMKNYQIRGASQQVASEITTARGKAIMKNVNYGVTLLVLSNNTYRYVIEDTPGQASREPLANVLSNATFVSQLGPVRTLPGNVRFGTGCTDTTLGAEGTFTGNDSGFRFTRLGAHCDPGSDTTYCPAITGNGLANSVYNMASGGAMVCLTQDINGDGTPELRRQVQVAPGGRVVQK